MALSTIALVMVLVVWFDCFLGSSGNCNKANEVRFVDSMHGSENDYSGIVEVCGAESPNEWNVICADDGQVSLTGVSNAVCRQRGYIGAIESDPKQVTDAIIKVLSSVSKAIESVKCPIVGDYYADGELVLMRCEHSDTPIDIRNCAYILEVQCNKTEITATPYNGQVWLEEDNYNENYKPLMMHLNTGGTEQGHVCLPKQLNTGKMTMVADTVCRQLGYTNSLTIVDDTKRYEGDVYYQINGDIDCGCTCPSLNCLVHCIDVNAISKHTSNCDPDFTPVEIECDYNQTIAAEYGAGSRGMCMLHNNIGLFSISGEGIAVITVFFILLVGWSVLSLFIIVCLVKKYIPCNKKNKTEEVNGLPYGSTNRRRTN